VPTPTVTVVGGGLSGLTAALRLAEKGCRVRLLEVKEMLGGNLATRRLREGGEIDIYPHMYLEWYVNFWKLLADVGVEREKSFRPFESVYQLRRRDESPRWSKLTNAYSPQYVPANLFGGVGPPPDMFIFGYGCVDLLAERAWRTVRLENMSLAGYMDSRPYMTDTAIKALETFIGRIWALPARLVSAKDAQTYLRYCLPAGDARQWLTSNSAEETVVSAVCRALRENGVEIVTNTKLTRIEVEKGRVTAIDLQRSEFDPHQYEWVGAGPVRREQVDEVILALPVKVLASVVREGTAGKRVVDAEPSLAALTQLESAGVPILNLCFNEPHPDLPWEPVGLFDSPKNLAFTAISQTWEEVPEFRDKTVLAVSCSEPAALTGPTYLDDGHQIMCELAEYVDFDPGDAWGESDQIDWSLTRYNTNADAQLSLNTVGAAEARPMPSPEKIRNLYIAGDYCHHHLGMTTIEAAVASGARAADELARFNGLDGVEVKIPPTWPDEVYAAARAAFMPAVGAAMALAARDGLSREEYEPDEESESLLSYLLTPGLPARHRRRKKPD